eukprot:760246-Hanusia_phi.AAC.2
MAIEKVFVYNNTGVLRDEVRDIAHLFLVRSLLLTSMLQVGSSATGTDSNHGGSREILLAFSRSSLVHLVRPSVQAKSADETTSLDNLDKEVIKFKLKVKCKKPPHDSADKEPINGKVRKLFSCSIHAPPFLIIVAALASCFILPRLSLPLRCTTSCNCFLTFALPALSPRSFSAASYEPPGLLLSTRVDPHRQASGTSHLLLSVGLRRHGRRKRSRALRLLPCTTTFSSQDFAPGRLSEQRGRVEV